MPRHKGESGAQGEEVLWMSLGVWGHALWLREGR